MNAAEALEYAALMLSTYLERYGHQWKRSACRKDIHPRLKRDLPYVLHETDREGYYMLVNRAYKPVGMDTGEWVDYEQYRHLHVKLTNEELQNVVLPPYSHGLFGDGSAPWRKRVHAEAYLARLRKLRTLLP
jgi:hypothetical protein